MIREQCTTKQYPIFMEVMTKERSEAAAEGLQEMTASSLFRKPLPAITSRITKAPPSRR
jgi:hypothetical protein